ncbi:MAG: hypothetical protein V2I76_06320, partial [Roseobacter sp.]|nr:hypothetical protein [Roseobacter sp.]
MFFMTSNDCKVSRFVGEKQQPLFPCLLIALLLLIGCETTVPQTEPVDFMARAETQAEGDVKVTSAVLSPEETVTTFA